MVQELPTEALRAIESAKRSQGWNMRQTDVQRFDLANHYGHAPCTLYVVPARCWVYRRRELAAATHRCRQDVHGSNAA